MSVLVISVSPRRLKGKEDVCYTDLEDEVNVDLDLTSLAGKGEKEDVNYTDLEDKVDVDFDLDGKRRQSMTTILTLKTKLILTLTLIAKV